MTTATLSLFLPAMVAIFAYFCGRKDGATRGCLVHDWERGDLQTHGTTEVICWRCGKYKDPHGFHEFVAAKWWDRPFRETHQSTDSLKADDARVGHDAFSVSPPPAGDSRDAE